MNPNKADMTGQGATNGPFNMSGFAPSNTNLSRISEPSPIADSLVTLCEHSKTGNVKIISDILLQQVENLSKTDRNY